MLKDHTFDNTEKSYRGHPQVYQSTHQFDYFIQEVAENTALKGVSELARGVEYTEPIKTSWRPPRVILSLPEKRHLRIWKKFHIDVEVGFRGF